MNTIAEGAGTVAHTDFWKRIDGQLHAIRNTKPDTAQAIADLLDPPSSAQAFFAGDYDDFLDAVDDAGWTLFDMQAGYYWIARHPKTGEYLGYVEGDVYVNPENPQSFILR